MRAVEDEAELALALWNACPEKRDVADELSRGPKLDGGAQPLAFGPKRAAGRLEREELARLSERSCVLVEPARVRLVAVDRVQCLEVLGQEGTEQEPRSLDRPGGLVHGVTVRESPLGGWQPTDERQAAEREERDRCEPGQPVAG